MNMRSKILAAAAASALALTIGTAASALTTYTIGTGNSAISGFPGPYGTVGVTLTNNTTANIVFTSNTPQFWFLGAQAADVNVNATSWTLSNLLENGAGTASNGGSNQADGAGFFNQTIDLTDGFTDRASSISFTLTNTSGTWGSDSTVLIGNNLGNTVAAHIGVCTTSPCTGFAATGFGTNTGGGIPEPATWAMMIVGFGGIGAMMRRRRSLALAIV
jgi:hypothetical protein